MNICTLLVRPTRRLTVSNLNADLALDVGSVTTRAANAKGDIIFEEPTLVACHQDSGRPAHFGLSAKELGTNSSKNLRSIRPMVAGQLADVELAQAYLQFLIRSLGRSYLRRRRVLVTTPLGATPVQLRAMTKALEQAGVARVRFLEQPLASALGAHIAIEAPLGAMVVDIGGEVSNIAVVALGGVVVGKALPFGGESLNLALARELLSRARVVVDPQVAGQIIHQYGTTLNADSESFADVVGRERVTGEQRVVRLYQSQLTEIITAEFKQLFATVRQIIATCPPDVAKDLVTSGIVLAGGGSLLPGLAEELSEVAGIPVHVYKDPSHLGVLGAARCLATFDELDAAFTTAPQR